LIFILSASNGLCGLSFKVYFRVEMQLNEAILSNKYSKLELSLLKKTKIKLFAPKYWHFELQTTQSVRNRKKTAERYERSAVLRDRATALIRLLLQILCRRACFRQSEHGLCVSPILLHRRG
jgi:hypothetical protein